MAKKEVKQSALDGLDNGGAEQAVPINSGQSMLIGPKAEQTHNITYESAFAQLETILQALEGDDLPLEESLVLYEQGIELVARCTHLLDSAELRVRQWQNGGTTTAFAGWQEG